MRRLDETFFGEVGFNLGSEPGPWGVGDLEEVGVNFEFEPDPWGKGDLTKFLGGENGGGILSLADGSSKVKHSLACPLGRVVSRNSAWRPCRQKFVTCDSWCLVKSSAVGLQRSWGADILLVSERSGVVSPQGHSANLLRSVFKLFKLGRLHLF